MLFDISYITFVFDVCLARPIGETDSAYVMTSSIDLSNSSPVTSNNRDDEELKRLRSQLDAFAETTHGWFWETDADHRFTYFSSSVFDHTGVPPEWHYGKTREELGIPSSGMTSAWKKHLEMIENHLPFSDFTFQRSGPDGVKWMRTSGKPVFDSEGKFVGYRGTATDITSEVAVENKAKQLVNAVEDLNEIFVLWDSNDRLVVCNRKFREINAAVAETTEPGTLFEDHIRAALAKGLYPNAAGREEDWFEERIKQHLNPGNAFELERQKGLWILLSEQKFPDGSVATISTDITERKRIERMIEEKNHILETALSTIPDGVQVLDKDLRLVAWNDQLFDVLDLDKDEILNATDPGKAFRYSLAGRGEYGPGDLDDLVASREAIARTMVPVEYERQLVTGKWMQCRGSPIEGGGYLAVYKDITERKIIHDRLAELATTDPLTGISNRRGFMNLADSEFERTRRYNRPLSFLLMDIDHFKSVNDNYGHGIGDEVICSVVNVCQKSLRGSDKIARYGGEEFIVMLPETNADVAVLLAERLRKDVADASVMTESDELHVTISIGITMVNQKHGTFEDVIAAADEALYEAKHGGRNQVARR